MRYLTLVISIAGIWLAAALVATFGSDTILTDHSMAKAYSLAMSFISDPKGVVGSKSSFPEVTKLYYSVVCWSLPFWFLIWWKWFTSQIGGRKTGLLFKADLSMLNRLFMLLLVPMWLFLTYAFSLNNGGDTRLVALGSSRLQLAVFGMGIPAGAAGTLAMAVFSVLRVFTFRKSGEK